MSISKPFDLLVLGENPSGFAAAACAAKSGARVAVLRGAHGHMMAEDIFASGIPNFVWRRLDLQGAGITLQPASARISLFEDGEIIKTFEDTIATKASLKKANITDGELWQDFVSELTEHAKHLAQINMYLGGGHTKNSAVFSPSLSELRFLVSTCAGFLNDYFESDRLRTHVASFALAPFGLGGDEPGSAGALSSVFTADAWPMRVSKGGPSVANVLERACVDARVTFLKGDIKRISAPTAKMREVDLGVDGVWRARVIYNASRGAGGASRAFIPPSLLPLDRRDVTEAQIRFTLSQPLEAPGGEDAVYFVAESLDEIITARADALQGRIPVVPPFSFEITPGGDIVVRAPYCPGSLRDDDVAREWAQQDRQKLSSRIMKRLSRYLDGFTPAVKRASIRLNKTTPDRDTRPLHSLDQRIVSAPASADRIGAAVRFADRLVSRA